MHRRQEKNFTYKNKYVMSTVEPPNSGHVWGRAFRSLFRGCPVFRGRNVLTIYRQGVNSLYILERFPLFRVSIIRSSTVLVHINDRPIDCRMLCRPQGQLAPASH